MESSIANGVQWLKLAVELTGALLVALGVAIGAVQFVAALLTRRTANFTKASKRRSCCNFKRIAATRRKEPTSAAARERQAALLRWERRSPPLRQTLVKMVQASPS